MAEHQAETDGDLLTKFVATGSQDAFEAVVKRHGALVLGVCRRQLGQTHDAEDAAQATFLTLVTKAKSLCKRESIAGWLYQVAFHISQKARDHAARRRQREQEVRAMHGNEAGVDEQSLWYELRSVLDQELNALPEKYRDVILLHHVQGHSLDQTARALGSNSGTISAWLHRGKEQLRQRLARRGVALPVGLLAILMTKYVAAEEISGALAHSTLAAASSALTGAGSTASPQVVALVKGAVKAMFYAKIKVAAVVALTIGIVGVGTGIMVHKLNAGEPAGGIGKSSEKVIVTATPQTPKDDIPSPNPDSLMIDKDTYTCIDDSLRKVPQYVIGGTFFSNRFVSPKFPCGGTLQIGARTPSVTALPDRLNHDAALTFNGGYLYYAGQGLDEKTFGQSKVAVVEQVRQIQFLSGMSEIRIENGNDVSSWTALLANDPANSLLRNQGATLMIGGDEKRGFEAAMGVAERLIFSGGMARHLKGSGGTPGSTSRSIIPWIVIGTYLQPGVGGMATYDPDLGVHCLTPGEYDKKLEGTPDRNVWIDNATLGENKNQIVNACVFKPYYGMEIGAGSTLTITSGFLQFAGSSLSGPSGPSAIGFHPHKKNWSAIAGTINFGAAEGIIWSNFDSKFGPNIVGAVIAGSGGLTIAGNNTLILLGPNTYTGKTCVSCGTLQIGDVFPTKARLGNGDVEVAAGATLRIKANIVDAIADTATVSLRNAGTSFHGVMDLENGINETVAGLILNGKKQPAGTYGSTASAAEHKLDDYFTGPGILKVNSDGPR